jgi:hypothetical protein
MLGYVVIRGSFSDLVHVSMVGVTGAVIMQQRPANVVRGTQSNLGSVHDVNHYA